MFFVLAGRPLSAPRFALSAPPLRYGPMSSLRYHAATQPEGRGVKVKPREPYGNFSSLPLTSGV